MECKIDIDSLLLMLIFVVNVMIFLFLNFVINVDIRVFFVLIGDFYRKMGFYLEMILVWFFVGFIVIFEWMRCIKKFCWMFGG